MVCTCAVVGCKNASDLKTAYNTNHRFHMFPLSNETLLKKWLHAIDRNDWNPSKHSRVCSDHFLPTDYKNYRRLKPDAVPSQLVPCSCSNSPQPPSFTFTPVDICSVLLKKDEPQRKVEYISSTEVHFEGPFSFRSCGSQTKDCCENTEELKRKIKVLQRAQLRSKNKILELQAVVNKMRLSEIKSAKRKKLLKHIKIEPCESDSCSALAQ